MLREVTILTWLSLDCSPGWARGEEGLPEDPRVRRKDSVVTQPPHPPRVSSAQHPWQLQLSALSRRPDAESGDLGDRVLPQEASGVPCAWW